MEHGGLCLILAHPDDESFFAVGLIAQAKRAGRPVELVLATAGEGGTPAPGTATMKGQLAVMRRREMFQVGALLGIDKIHWLGLADRHVADFTPDHVHLVTRILRHQRPEVVFTFAPDGHNGHPDHIAIHALASEALSLAQQPTNGLPESEFIPPSVLWTTGVPPWGAHDGPALLARTDVDYLLELGEDRALKDRSLRLHHSQRHHINSWFFGADESGPSATFEVFQHGGGPRLVGDSRFAGCTLSVRRSTPAAS